jgi:hypothetical protein
MFLGFVMSMIDHGRGPGHPVATLSAAVPADSTGRCPARRRRAGVTVRCAVPSLTGIMVGRPAWIWTKRVRLDRGPLGAVPLSLPVLIRDAVLPESRKETANPGG